MYEPIEGALAAPPYERLGVMHEMRWTKLDGGGDELYACTCASDGSWSDMKEEAIVALEENDRQRAINGHSIPGAGNYRKSDEPSP